MNPYSPREGQWSGRLVYQPVRCVSGATSSSIPSLSSSQRIAVSSPSPSPGRRVTWSGVWKVELRLLTQVVDVLDLDRCGRGCSFLLVVGLLRICLLGIPLLGRVSHDGSERSEIGRETEAWRVNDGGGSLARVRPGRQGWSGEV